MGNETKKPMNASSKNEWMKIKNLWIMNDSNKKQYMQARKERMIEKNK